MKRMRISREATLQYSSDAVKRTVLIVENESASERAKRKLAELFSK